MVEVCNLNAKRIISQYENHKFAHNRILSNQLFSQNAWNFSSIPFVTLAISWISFCASASANGMIVLHQVDVLTHDRGTEMESKEIASVAFVSFSWHTHTQTVRRRLTMHSVWVPFQLRDRLCLCAHFLTLELQITDPAHERIDAQLLPNDNDYVNHNYDEESMATCWKKSNSSYHVEASHCIRYSLSRFIYLCIWVDVWNFLWDFHSFPDASVECTRCLMIWCFFFHFMGKLRTKNIGRWLPCKMKLETAFYSIISIFIKFNLCLMNLRIFWLGTKHQAGKV